MAGRKGQSGRTSRIWLLARAVKERVRTICSMRISWLLGVPRFWVSMMGRELKGSLATIR
jgi:hypothetical protein